MPSPDPDQRSEFRRAKRAEERKNKMRCFVCRAFSHAAKDCPQNVSGDTQGKDTVGICFRCGSTEHSLAQCQRPRSEQADELPFATCYICSEKVRCSRYAVLTHAYVGPFGIKVSSEQGKERLS